MSKNKDKTNVMRILDQKKITYISHNYESTGAISGVEVAQALDQDPDMVFRRWLPWENQKQTMYLSFR